MGNRIRQKGESNGKACNLNNTLRNLYPPGQPVDPNEVGWRVFKVVKLSDLAVAFHELRWGTQD